MIPPTGHPLLCRGLVIVPDGDALLVDGGPRRRRLTGKAVTSLLPRVLPLLDGTRQAGTIATAADLDQALVDRLLAFLDDCDVLEWLSRPSAQVAGAVDHVTAYFSRTIGAVAGLSSTEELSAELADAAVLLVADGPIAAKVADDLVETGVGEVGVRNGTQPLGREHLARLARSPRRLVAVLDDGGQVLPDTVTLARGSGIPVLRFAGDAGTTEIGPVFYENWTPCVSCFRAGYGVLGEAACAEHVPSELTAALVAAEIVTTLAQVGGSPRPWRMTRVRRSAWHTEAFDMLPGIGCATCGHAAPPSDAGEAGAAALAYEWQHEIRPGPLSAPKTSTRERRLRIAALQFERDVFPPAPARDLGGEFSGGAALLAELLARTAGRRMPSGDGRAMDRWAPSGGNLGSVQLYIATERDLFGLPGTLFRYDDLGHRIVAVRADPIPLDSLLSSGVGLDSRDVVLIFVASVSRIANKYEEFAPRLSHLDTGCAALQLSVAAAARDVAVSFAAGWRPGLVGLLELEPDGEVVTAVAVVDGTSLEGTVSCR